jgi:hypothetical protein
MLWGTCCAGQAWLAGWLAGLAPHPPPPTPLTPRKLLRQATKWCAPPAANTSNSRFTGAPTQGVGIGTGPFYAGYSATGFYTGYGYTYVASSVWWSEINSANACQPGTDIYKQWSQPNKLCDTNGNFVMPSAVIAIQATTCLATIFSFFACALGYSVTASHEGGSYGAAVASLLAMVFSICAFALWCTWDMSMALRTSPGGVVPLFTTTAGQIQPSSNVSVSPARPAANSLRARPDLCGTARPMCSSSLRLST